MKKIFVATISLALLFTIQPTVATPTNLVVNGDFELPEVTNSSKWQIFSSDVVPGWTVEWAGAYPGAPLIANLELHEGVLMPAYDGDQSVEMDTDWSSANGEPASVKIYQDIETCAGGEYTLSYAWSPRPGHGNNAMEVYWGGGLVGNHSGSVSGWNLVTLPSLTPTGDTTRLEFIETANPDSLGMFLDAVSVEQTKECVVDVDNDGINDNEDNCPTDPNPDQEDIDGDGIGDVCDLCPNDPANDEDGDGICGDVDNCPGISNPNQEDVDEDEIGDACDLDNDNDDINNSEDLCSGTETDEPSEGLKTNRWIWDGNDWITGLIPGRGKGPQKSFTMEATKGCSCEQILTWLHETYPEEYGEMKGHRKFGCSISVMEEFIELTK